ncbi:MAG: hypothetical protein GY950_17095 [bacterium]|nr:hypothetical protein [bacterium]
MENKKLRDEILNEAVRIGEWLTAKAKKEETGTSWETMSMDLDRNIGWQTTDGIYSGVSGIALFFLELHKRTGEAEYLATAREGMRWVVDYCKKNPSQYYSFFTGRMGTPYVLLKMAEFTGEKSWKDDALELARSCTEFLDQPQSVDDLINGSSGTIVSLLHLHAATGEKWLLEVVDSFTRKLIHSAFHGSKGLYWDRSPKIINGLCGFSHGAAGIGWVFLELGRYFQNHTFYHLARQAFLYESRYYNHDLKNWQDLRKGIYNDEDEEKYRKAYNENDMAFFTTGGDMNAWCHGAAGIGLSRLRAVELFKEAFPGDDTFKIYEDDLTAAIEKTIVTDTETETPAPLFILCHGGGGNADLFLKAYEMMGDKKYLAPAEKVAQRILAFYKERKMYFPGFRSDGASEDTSLFMGNAGIGYFLLRLLAPHDVPSILAPSLNAVFKPEENEDLSAYPFLSLSLPDAGKELLLKYFSRTLAMGEKYFPQQLADFLDNTPISSHTEPIIHSFINFADKLLPSLPPKEQNCISDVFILEREKINMDETVISNCYLDIKSMVLKENADELNKLDAGDFLNLTLKLEPDTRIATTDWDWNLDRQEEWQKNLNLEPDIYPLLLKPSPLGVIEEPLSPLSYTILGAFEDGNTVENVRKETIDAFESLTPDQEKMLTGKIIEQIQHALTAGILVGTKK